LSFRFNYDGIKYRIRDSARIKKLLEGIVSDAGFKSGAVNIILTDDLSLRKINNDFLKHDYFTDVITFGYGEDGIVVGEIYISADTVKINSKIYNTSFRNELFRVIIHGVLHLIGMDDGTEEERKVMREREDYWLKILSET
jgi:probable rRNA maturation factor